MRSLKALFVRRHFGEVLDRVSQRGQHVIITRGNRPLLAMIPYLEYQQKVVSAEEVKRRRRVVEEIQRLRRKLAPKLHGVDVVREIRQLRDRS